MVSLFASRVLCLLGSCSGLFASLCVAIPAVPERYLFPGAYGGPARCARQPCLGKVHTAVTRQMSVTRSGGEEKPDQKLEGRRCFQWFSACGL